MINKIKTWFCKKRLKREYFIGVDMATGEDCSCEVTGYRNLKTGQITITKIKYYK